MLSRRGFIGRIAAAVAGMAIAKIPSLPVSDIAPKGTITLGSDWQFAQSLGTGNSAGGNIVFLVSCANGDVVQKGFLKETSPGMFCADIKTMNLPTGPLIFKAGLES